MSIEIMKYYSSHIVGMKPGELRKFLTRLGKRDQTFEDVDFRGVLFHDIDFTIDNVFPAGCFWECDFSKTIFCECVISGAKSVGANFLGTVFVNCEFYNWDIIDKAINQCGRHVGDAYKSDKFHPHDVTYETSIPPLEISSEVVGYKLLDGNPMGRTWFEKPLLAELVIPTDAEKVLFKGGKCRASKAFVRSIQRLESGEPVDVGYSPISDNCLAYRIGETVAVYRFDESYAECTCGIHFFLSKEDAMKFYKEWVE